MSLKSRKVVILVSFFILTFAIFIGFFQACSPYKSALKNSSKAQAGSSGSTTTTSTTSSSSSTSSTSSTTLADDCQTTKKIAIFDFYKSGAFPQTKRLYDEYDPAHSKIVVYSYNSNMPSDIPALFNQFISDVSVNADIDQKRLFVSGYSGGATMATLMGLDNADRFAGIVYITQGVQYPEAIASEVAEAARRIPFYIIDDPTRQGWYAMKQILSNAGFIENEDFFIKKIDGLGHNIPAAAQVPELFQWLDKTRLDQVCP